MHDAVVSVPYSIEDIEENKKKKRKRCSDDVPTQNVFFPKSFRTTQQPLLILRSPENLLLYRTKYNGDTALRQSGILGFADSHFSRNERV
jgi:hypothetical protein